MNASSVELSYPWYSQVGSSEPLQQGDFILKCQIFQPVAEAYKNGQNIEAIAKEYDVIVMSQSCDLIYDKIDLVLVSPFYSLKKLGNIQSNYKNSEMKERLRKGQIIGMHLLDKCNISSDADYLVIDFKSTFAVPLFFVKQIISGVENRKRLLPPYREHLSQAFARFFMRVGLPIDIPSFI